MENNAQEMVSHFVVLYCSPCSASRSPPSCHCPLLPITVPSFPSLSPSFPSLSPPSSPSHHCPLLPITVPSFPSLTAPQHLVCRAVQSLHTNHMQMGIIEVFICRHLHMNTSMILICIWLVCRLCTTLHTTCCGAVTVPSSLSLSPPPHHIMLSWQIVFSHYSQDIPSFPQSSQLKRTPLEC